MKKVISASRRTDLVAFFPDWLCAVLKDEKAKVYGPAGHAYAVDLSPKNVHTIVLWSKNFTNVIENRRLRTALQKYGHIYLLFTITGLGGSFIEKGAPQPSAALSQLDPLIELAGKPERLSIRFDPVVCWKEDGRVRTNLGFFERMAPELSRRGIRDVRFSFAQWYGKAVRRSAKYGFAYVDPSQKEKKEAALVLSQIAGHWNFCLYCCTQNFLCDVQGIRPSACIDGASLQNLHPAREPVSTKKDRSQRTECRCTESVDIGSYTQFCTHSCLYCYANPRV